jgi:lipoprotein-anchoring transpeptidase ErfK/SrfK
MPAPTTTPTPALRVTPVPLVDSEWLILVQRSQQRVTIYRRGQEQKSYAVSTGKSDTITPLGWWKIVEKKALDPPGIYGTRWLGFQRWNSQTGRYEWYAESPPFGLHGTNEPEKIGSAVSLGCVRLRNQDVEELYELIPLGTYVLVVD